MTPLPTYKTAESFDFYHSFKKESLPVFYAKLAGIFSLFALVFANLAAWVTHVVVCIKTTSWILMVFGIVIPPIGIIHGWGVWFGWFV
jgi:uncharacterized membrane protein YGL010W